MQEILYLEIPYPDMAAVTAWLHHQFDCQQGQKICTAQGFRLQFSDTSIAPTISERAEQTTPLGTVSPELSVFVWTAQRTTYLKVFRWWADPLPGEGRILRKLVTEIRQQFPHRYPQPPAIAPNQSIFEVLDADYPLTVKYFRRMPKGEFDLQRVYWWEQRWRESVQNPTQPRQVVFAVDDAVLDPDAHFYDLIYIGGALGVIHAAVMARLGYKVLLIERLPFGRMNREWNISRQEFQSLIHLGLFTPGEFEELIAREYVNGFNKFFDSNNPAQATAPVLETPTVLNLCLDAEKLLQLCGEKLQAAGGDIWDETEFSRVDIALEQVTVHVQHLPSQTCKSVQGRLLVDAMGTASAIAWQLNGGRAFDSVCPTVGAVIDGGFEPGVWDSRYGDVLNSHGDISRGRQLIWELFPGKDNELTFYLFHYHQVNSQNPGSLLEMYEDFFTILPEYRRCDMERLVWKKPTFGYIPGHFSVKSSDRQVAFDRLIAIGDAASLQSPLVFTGFGSLVRNLPRLTDLLDTALRHDLLQATYLNQIRAFQSNIAVTWLFSKGMMVPTGRFLPPYQVNAMLNTFFGILAEESPEVTDRFIKDRAGWVPFNLMAIKAAWKNPSLLLWIWKLAGPVDLLRWLGAYLNFTLDSLISALCGWLPRFARKIQPWLEPRYPSVWFWLLAQSYRLTYGMGQPQRAKMQTRSPLSASVEPLTAKSGR